MHSKVLLKLDDKWEDISNCLEYNPVIGNEKIWNRPIPNSGMVQQYQPIHQGFDNSRLFLKRTEKSENLLGYNDEHIEFEIETQSRIYRGRGFLNFMENPNNIICHIELGIPTDMPYIDKNT